MASDDSRQDEFKRGVTNVTPEGQQRQAFAAGLGVRPVMTSHVTPVDLDAVEVAFPSAGGNGAD